MKIVRILFLVLAVCFSQYCQAQDIEVIEPLHVSDLQSKAPVEIKNDLNGNPCAVVEIQLPVAGATFEGNVVASEYKDNRYIVYLTKGTRKFRIKCPGYHTMTVDVTETVPAGLEGSVAYVLVLALPVAEEVPVLTTDCTDPAVLNIIHNMVFVKGGTYTMGATPEQGSDAEEMEKPAHQEEVGDFFICKYVVTQKEWKAIMGNNPSKHKGDDLPVEHISLFQEIKFLQKLEQMTNLPFSEPTEIEWEYAARGGQLSKGYKYAGSNNLDSVGWYAGNSGGVTHPVGLKAPNELGLYDMSGNVKEKVLGYNNKYDNEGKPVKIDGLTVSNRGGCYKDIATECRVSAREGKKWNLLKNNKYENIGLRLVITRGAKRNIVPVQTKQSSTVNSVQIIK